MVAISIQIEGQNGLTWSRWKKLVVEELMLQWFDMDDIDRLRAFAESVLPLV